ncbi:hypothetical protein MAR_032423 [Mya arenaria]|uniref:Uncharacterized protein n=1 Tax=Mya arenaria TaxID=6604 RepID=A0ABY7F9J4_MYAAR|nr:hypothetical protein MAR_032423 [Mya arenaria]
MATYIGHTASTVILGKAKFQIVLHNAIEQVSSASIREAFRLNCGRDVSNQWHISGELNSDAESETRIVGPHTRTPLNATAAGEKAIKQGHEVTLILTGEEMLKELQEREQFKPKRLLKEKEKWKRNMAEKKLTKFGNTFKSTCNRKGI